MNDMTARERVDAQTRIRRALLRNGYVPLANVDKKCVLAGWPKLIVTDETISAWADQMRHAATGVRIDGPLVALDFDIDDDNVLDLIWKALPDTLCRLLDSAPLRFGGGVKFTIFLRRAAGESGFGHMVSQGHSPPGSDVVMRVEAFDSKSARQFGVYGARSHGPGNVIETEYTWADGWGLADVPLAMLPEITVAQIKEVCDAASRAMRDAGWTFEVRTHEGIVDDSESYGLNDSMRFDTQDHGTVDLAGLEALCAEHPHDGVRLSASWLEGPSAVNRSRCIARLNAADGRVQIWESASCKLHRPESLDIGARFESVGRRLRAHVATGGPVTGTPATGGLSRLQAILDSVPPDRRMFSDSDESSGGAAPDEEEVAAAQDTLLDELLARYAYWSDGKGYVVDVNRGPETAMTLPSFRAKTAPFSWMEKTKRGETEINPADLWLKDSRRLDVDGYRFLPWTRERLVEDRGGLFVNVWERPAHWDTDADAAPDEGAVNTFALFLEHLIPNERERDWFLQWLAAKVQRPWVPNCGIIMVAERQGVGRGTLFDMLRAVFGSRHVRSVGAAQLFGGGSQAQYTDWQADSLVVTCDEVLAGGDTAGVMAWKRQEAYERLKALVDPRAREVMVVRKTLPNYQGETFASFLLATNNMNALPISQDDRRIAVILNGSTPLVSRGDVMAALDPWRSDVGFGPAFGAALYRWLLTVEVDRTTVREAPTWMEGRERMLAANESDLDSLLDSVLRDIPGDYILGNHLHDRLRHAIMASGREAEFKNWWTRASDMLGRINNFGWRRRDGRCRYQPSNLGHGVALVFYRDTEGALARWEAASLDDRVAMWKTAGDVNQKASRLIERLAERGLTVQEGGRAR